MRFIGSQDSTRARRSWVLCMLLGLALPAFAKDAQPELCARLASLADAAGDGHVRQVRIIWREGRERPECGGAGTTERAFCRWLTRDVLSTRLIPLSQRALSCLGLNPEPPADSDPDEFVAIAWWTAGGFIANSGPLARDHLAFAMDMNIGAKTEPRWMLFTATPK